MRGPVSPLARFGVNILCWGPPVAGQTLTKCLQHQRLSKNLIELFQKFGFFLSYCFSEVVAGDFSVPVLVNLSENPPAMKILQNLHNLRVMSTSSFTPSSPSSILWKFIARPSHWKRPFFPFGLVGCHNDDDIHHKSIHQKFWFRIDRPTNIIFDLVHNSPKAPIVLWNKAVLQQGNHLLLTEDHIKFSHHIWLSLPYVAIIIEVIDGEGVLDHFLLVS